MGYAIPFIRNFAYINQPGIQLNINYKPKIKELDNFLEQYGSYRINIIFSDFNQNNDPKIIKALQEKYPNSKLVLVLPYYEKELEEFLCQKNFLHYYSQLVNTWDRFQGFLKLNVTDIFIAEELCFSIKDLKEQAQKRNIDLRCYCNVCQSSWDDTPSLKTFFIRPEDIDLYKDYIDTFEFYVGQKDFARINTLYKIYEKDKRWMGPLNEIIIGYEGNEESAFILPRFGEKRLNCGKRCFKNSRCRFCELSVETGELLKKHNFYFMRKDI